MLILTVFSLFFSFFLLLVLLSKTEHVANKALPKIYIGSHLLLVELPKQQEPKFLTIIYELYLNSCRCICQCGVTSSSLTDSSKHVDMNRILQRNHSTRTQTSLVVIQFCSVSQTFIGLTAEKGRNTQNICRWRLHYLRFLQIDSTDLG